MGKIRHPFKIALLILAGLILLFVAVLHIVLNTKVLNRMVDRFAAEYIDGDISFKKASFSLFRHFPNVTVTIEDFDIVYDHDRFHENDSVDYYLLHSGHGEIADTLATFSSFSVTLNLMEALRGRFIIPYATLDRPRIFAHMFGPGEASWDIIKFSSDENEDPADTLLPDISIRRVRLTGDPRIVFTDPTDTLFATIALKELHFDGDFRLAEPGKSIIGLDIDSMMVAARLPADTMALRLNKCVIHNEEDSYAFDATADAFLATRAFGRMKLPVASSGVLGFPGRSDGAFAVSLGDFHLQAATIGLDGMAEAVMYDDSTYIRAKAEIKDSPIRDLTAFLGDLMPELKKLDTEAVISLDASCDGFYVPATGSIPDLSVEFTIPSSEVAYEGIGRKGFIGLDLTAHTGRTGQLDVMLNDMLFDAGGLELRMKGKAEDLLGEDPELGMEGSVSAQIDTLTKLFTEEYGIHGTGSLKAEMKGRMRMSQLDMTNFAGADIAGRMSIDNLHIDDSKDSVCATIRHADVRLRTTANRIDDSIPADTRVLGLMADIDSLDLTYLENIFLRAGSMNLTLQTSPAIITDTVGMPPLMGRIKASSFEVRDETGLTLSLDGSHENFRIVPASANGGAVLSMTGSNASAGIRMDDNTALLNDLKFSISARKAERSQRSDRRQEGNSGRRREEPDSLTARERLAPEWLREQSFKSSDLNLRLDESLAKYFREWNVEGSLSLAEGGISTPLFPAENSLRSVSGRFTNDRVDIDSFTFRSGESDISAKGSLSGIRRALLARNGSGAALKLEAELSSEKINANEILDTYLKGSVYLESDTVVTSVPDSASYALIIVPADLNATVRLNAGQIKYDDLDIRRLVSKLTMRQRCLQIVDAEAESNMGDIRFEGFYSTRTKDDLKAGFNMGLSNITADKVIRLFPAVDTIIPMLKSFAGDLNCQMAATTDLDTNMNLRLPSIDGVFRISGTNLTLKESEEFTSIAKTLMFKDKQSAHVDRMAVDGMIRDNRLEVFPFVFTIDRYILAASGLQYLDSSYKYHISVIKSPLPLKFGVNVYGDDFDHMKINVGKALYKSSKVPVFSQQLDTVQTNLAAHIRDIFNVGVSRAIEANRRQNVIREHMEKVNYDADMISEELPDADIALLNMAKDEMDNPSPVDEIPETELIPEEILVIEEDDLIGDIIKDAETNAKASRKALRKEQKAAKAAEKAAKAERKKAK